jgi:hypothetical protein
MYANHELLLLSVLFSPEGAKKEPTKDEKYHYQETMD